MRLDQLLKVLSFPFRTGLDLDIGKYAFHSKQVEKGDLFVAIPGVNTDGHHFIDDAISAGDCAVIGERAMVSLSVPYFQVSDARLALSLLAADLYGHPYRNHTMIGITGTNGKTITAHLIRYVIEYFGQSCSLFGTVERYINGESYPSRITTADPVQLMHWLHESRDDNVVMEVSFHGLVQKRVDRMNFDFALFTNLSLDYHHTFDHYFHAKARLFSLLKHGGEAVVNTNCRWGRKLVENLQQQGIPVYTFGEQDRYTR
ncbi:Mur ligase family protein [Brevibacillus thermoruber]|uniref:Mur ligase family protein n=1 Tax=Brevibacillus thermoruber TaxID=33942 RepID=UPI0040427333